MEKVLPLESEFRSIGISPNTKVSQCVKNLTQLLRENDKRPICLHTLPKLKGDITTDNSKKQKLEKPQTDALEGDKEEDIVEGDEIKLVKQIEKVIAKSRLNPSNNSIVKLISIVEIVKRQLSETGHPSFLESINDSKPKEQVRAEGKHNLTYGKENSRDMTNEDRGSSKSKNQDSIHKEKNEQVALHQYNQIDCLENLISIIMKDSQNKSNQVIDDDDGENKANNLINRKRKSIVENHNKKIIDEFLNQERKR
ncbi:hypothetical protein BY996DRAFT_6413545 [Phakopsora pachyrhizi]|nr:hypothetical protein BY996DRAFT_6413545 [Phakopsora pachyrhizi]